MLFRLHGLISKEIHMSFFAKDFFLFIFSSKRSTSQRPSHQSHTRRVHGYRDCLLKRRPGCSAPRRVCGHVDPRLSALP